MKRSPTPSSYRDYVTDDRFMAGYAEYQARYASQIRESDRVLLELVGTIVEAPGAPEHPRLLDVGCSTGNLLLHLKHAFPALELVGADMAGSILDECRRNPDLEGVRFEELDLLELGVEAAFDVVIVNAVLYLLALEELTRALASVSRALVPGGSFLAFDFFHPFEQDLTVVEKSETHPEGLVLHLRPYSELEAVLDREGFEGLAFRPFAIPVDLPAPSRSADMTSYTQRTDSGERLLFRGTLFQPWCHLVARKGGA